MTRDELNTMMKTYFKTGGVVTVYEAPKKRTTTTMRRAKRTGRPTPKNPNMGFRTTNWQAFGV